MGYVPKYLQARTQLFCICGAKTSAKRHDGWELVNTKYPRCPKCTRARRAYYAENARRHNKNNVSEFKPRR